MVAGIIVAFAATGNRQENPSMRVPEQKRPGA
jgi:hypothetical protein